MAENQSSSLDISDLHSVSVQELIRIISDVVAVDRSILLEWVETAFYSSEVIIYVGRSDLVRNRERTHGLLIITDLRVLYLRPRSFFPPNKWLFFYEEISITQIDRLQHSPPVFVNDGHLIVDRSGKDCAHFSEIDRILGSPLIHVHSYLDATVKRLQWVTDTKARMLKELKERQKLAQAEQRVRGRLNEVEDFIARWEAGEDLSEYLLEFPHGYPKNWAELRKQILERDDYQCGNCGQHSPHVILEVHHIVPITRGGTNLPSNLRTLCQGCHRQAHQGKVNDEE